MKKIISIMLALLLSLSMTGCNKKYGDFTESEIAQIGAAQDAAQTGEIPQSWLHTEGETLTYEGIAYKVNSLNITDTLPENLEKQADENYSVDRTKYEHFLVLNLTMTNTGDTEAEILLDPWIYSINNGNGYSKWEPWVFDKHQYPHGHDYCKYTFQPNEEVTSDFVFNAHERELTGDLYFSPGFYSCSFVKAADAPFEAPQRQTDNPNLEIWDEIFSSIKSSIFTEDSDPPAVMPKPAQGTLKKSDVSTNGEDELTFVIKNMERDYVLEYLNLLIFEGYDHNTHNSGKEWFKISEPTVDSKAGTISLNAAYWGFFHDIVYTESTKEMRVRIYSVEKEARDKNAGGDKK